jgi:hypothetical protein
MAMRDALRRRVVRVFCLGGALAVSPLPAGCGRGDTGGAASTDAAGPDDARRADAAVDASRPDAARPDAARPDAARPDAARPDAAIFPPGPGAPDAGRWVLRLANGPVQDPLTLILVDVHVVETGQTQIGRLVVEISTFSETLAERVVIAADGSMTLDREALLTPWGAMDVHLEGSFMGPRFLCEGRRKLSAGSAAR